jgi:uncharacterized membrane protein
MSPLLILHVAAGTIGALAGAAALTVRKGERLHRAFGGVFVAAMLTMAASATYLSVLHQPGTFFTSIFTFYLVASAWMTVRRPEGRVGLYEKIALAIVLFCLAGTAYASWRATVSSTGAFLGYRAFIYDIFAAIAALCAILDIKVLRAGGISGVRRITRHLWRMCLGFSLAAASALTQLLKVLPGHVAGVRVLPILATLALSPLLLLFFWLIRVRFTGWYRGGVQTA